MEFLLINNLLAPIPSTELDAIYRKGKIQCGEKPQAHEDTENPNLDSVLINESDAHMVNIAQYPQDAL